MSSNEERTPEELDRILRGLPDQPTPPSNHIDDGELAAHRAGRVSVARAQEIDGHLAECRSCRDLLAELARPTPELRVPATVSRLIPLSRWMPIALAASALLAIGASIVLSSKPSSVPTYAVRLVRGGVEDLRGAAEPVAAQSIEVEPHARVLFVLEPTKELEKMPALSAYVSREGGPMIATAFSLSESGVVKIEGRASEFFVAGPGRYSLEVIVSDVVRDLQGLTPLDAKKETPNAQWIKIDVTMRAEVKP